MTIITVLAATAWVFLLLRIYVQLFSRVSAPGILGMPLIEPDFPFTTDGCSGGMTILWNKLFGKDPPWEDLCRTHDKAYWRGGTREQRHTADLALYCGVLTRGYATWAILIYWGIRLGGVPWLPTSWRWAYGWRFPRDYVK